MLEAFDNAIHEVGGLAFLALGLAAMLEYVVPPFPGDTIVILGGIYAVRGQQPYWLVFVAVTAGSVLGALINFTLGQWLGAYVERYPERRKVFGISVDAVHSVEAKMRRFGSWLILANRFLPAVRGLFFVAAGMAQMPRAKVLALGALSAMAYNVLMLSLGVALGGNAERLGLLLRRYHLAVYGLGAIAALALLVRFLARRKKGGVAAP